MKKIAASILGKENKAQLINKLIDKGIDTIHYDVMDGVFVDNHSLPIEEVLDIFSSTKKHYKDVHLMVQNPSSYLESLYSMADQISIHIESNVNIKEILKSYPNKIGIAINPETPVKVLEEYIPYLNHVMIMSVVPGRGGQTFIEESIAKVNELVELKEEINNDLIIEIDGGINNIWGPVVFESGVNLAVSGSYLINNIEDNSIEKILGKK